MIGRVIAGTTAGAAVSELLGSEASGSGKILAVYRRSLIWVVGSDDALTLSMDRRQRGPVVLEADGSPAMLAGLTAGDPVVRRGATLCFGTAIAVDISAIKLWDPPLPRVTHAGGAVLRQAIHQSLTRSAARNGLSELAGQDEPTSVWARTARPRVVSLLAGLRSESPATIDVSVQGLIGLGPGLTPAGDDFLAGMLAALQSADTVSAGRQASLLGQAIRQALAGTTLVSRQLLRWALRGRYGETVHAVFAQSVQESVGPLLAPIATLLSVGATSGADTAAGIWFGLGVVEG